MASLPAHANANEEDGDGDVVDYDTDSGSSAPNSEDIIFEDEEDVAAELIRLEDEDCLEQIPVILRLTPPVAPGGPPVLELWGSRPFGYCGSSFIWTTFRAEPESEDVDDSDGTCWAPLGITGVDPFTYYRAMVVRQTNETMDRPPAERRMLILSYVKTEDQARISRGAILVNTYSYSPEEPVIRGNDHVVSTFWIIACGKVTDRKDRKRIAMKMSTYIEVVKEKPPRDYFKYA